MKRIIVGLLTLSIALYPQRSNSAALTLSVLCAATCKYIGAAAIVVGGYVLHTSVYQSKEKYYYLEKPSIDNSTVKSVQHKSIGTVEADSLIEGRQKCKELAKQRGVDLLTVISTSDGKYKCIATWNN